MEWREECPRCHQGRDRETNPQEDAKRRSCQEDLVQYTRQQKNATVRSDPQSLSLVTALGQDLLESVPVHQARNVEVQGNMARVL